jgi:hypothetical protein
MNPVIRGSPPALSSIGEHSENPPLRELIMLD